MRLRKNTKLTSSIIWSTAASSSSPTPPGDLLQAHVCVLNRSPWDASPSPPPSPPPRRHQVIEGDTDSLACDDFLPADYSMRIIPNPIEPGSSGNSIVPPKRRPGRPRKPPYYYSGIDNNDNKKKSRRNVHRPSSGSSSSCSRIIEETDDDDDDDESDGVGRKRMRKAVKERSLKSLIM